MNYRIIIWTTLIFLFVYVLSFSTSPAPTKNLPRIHPSYILGKYALNNQPLETT